ncbi:hypothetical protein ACA910_019637 [Epithemia clementina (nom. ined.)]
MARYKVAVVGSGAMGSYFGARLWEAGHNVQFYHRSKPSLEESKAGLYVSSPTDGDIHIPSSEWETFDDTSQMQVADWVLVAVKSYALDAIPNLIWPLLQPNTRVLAILNGLVDEDLLLAVQAKSKAEGSNNANNRSNGDGLSCCAAVYGGVAFLGSNRTDTNHIEHLFGNRLSAGVAATSTSLTGAVAFSKVDEDAFLQLFQGTKVAVEFETNLLLCRWRKMMGNVPFNGISVAMGGIAVDEIARDPGLRELAMTIIDEIVATANAELESFYGPAATEDDETGGVWKPLGEAEKAKLMDYVDNSVGNYQTSTTMDFLNRRPMEVKYMFREPIDRADRLGVPVPHLRTIVAILEAYQRKYHL